MACIVGEDIPAPRFATVAITWSERAYSVSLVSSYNPREEGGQVHRAYNAWVRNLEREINDAR